MGSAAEAALFLYGRVCEDCWNDGDFMSYLNRFYNLSVPGSQQASAVVNPTTLISACP